MLSDSRKWGVARHHRLLHGGADLLQLYLEIIRRDAGQHQQKLVAAVADQQICFPDAAADGLCNGFQCQISGVVAVGIVADLEIVDIHQSDARRPEVIAHHFLVIAAVVGAGQGVVVQPLPVALFFFHAPGSSLGKLRLLLLHLLHHPQQIMVGGFQRLPLGTVLLFQLFPQFHIGGDIRDRAHDIAFAVPFHLIGSVGDPAVAVFAQNPEDAVTILGVSRAVFRIPVAQPGRQIIRVYQRCIAVIEPCRKFFPLPAQYLQKTVTDISKRIAVFRILCAAVKAARYILCIAFQPQKSLFYRLACFHLVFPVSFSVYRTLTARGTPCCRNLQIYLPMMPRFWAYYNILILSSKPPRCKHFLPVLPVERKQLFPFTPLPVKRVHRSVRRRSGVPKKQIIFPLKMPRAKRRAFPIVPRSKKAAAQKVQRLCGASPHSQRSAMIHHIPGRLIRPSRCSNTISMVFSFQTVRFSRTAPSVKTEAA